jgi:hypothetical protein
MDGDARWYLKSSKTADGQVRGNITDALFEIADALEPDMYTQSIQALRDELAKEAKKPGKSRDQFDPLSEL